MKLSAGFLLLLLFITNLKAEILSGSTTVLDTVGGKAMFILYDGIEINATSFKDDWCMAGLEVIVDIRLLKDSGDWILPKGMKLVSWQGKVVGELLNDYIFYLGYEGRNAREQTVLVTGYIHRSNIRESSIVENKINEAIGTKERVIFKDLKKHLDEFDYQTDGQFQGFRTYLCYENIIDTYAPIDRIRFVFKDSNLICIIHTRKLELPGTIDTPQIKYSFLFYNFVEEAIRLKFISDYNRFFKTIEI